ncbi:WD40 repeat domain-containing protein [Methanoculleus sp. Wushi-C6]|uniref:WD40 repeat domain-containing protein n=1 Tax=Methanoculleus caldifontis TaxID=2651577 RepID=A0ABU3X098_9EURY|nr:PQQ-binding-like beta-propeller repeat protein [Methanoculleus sp. Wushi-C6]MDV2481451.1 WD40 repeat domain-containing protein [Methanoculleus sp. Wushi-C6]
MKRAALLIVLIAVLVPAAAGEDSSYYGIPAGGIVNDVAIAADGRYMVAGTGEGSIVCLQRNGTIAWNVSAGNAVTAVAAADAGNYIAAGTDAGEVLLLDERNGNRYWTASVAGPVRDLAFSGDGRALAVGGNRITLFDHLGAERWNASIGGSSPVSPITTPVVPTVAFTADGNYIVAGSDNGAIHFLRRQGTRAWQALARGPITAVDVSRDGSVVAAGGRDRALLIYNREGGLVWAMPTGAPILTLALSADGRFAAVGKEGGDLECYRPREGLLWTNRTGGDVLAVDISRQGEAVAAGTAAGSVHLFSGAGNARWSFDAGAPVTAVALSRSGDYLAAGAGEQAFIFRTADVPVPAPTGPAENATPVATPTRAGGAGALIGIVAVTAAVAGSLFRRR